MLGKRTQIRPMSPQNYKSTTVKYLSRNLEIKEISNFASIFFVYIPELLHARHVHRHEYARNFSSPAEEYIVLSTAWFQSVVV